MEEEVQTTPEQPVYVPLIPAVPAPPITSRFLFVDVAAMRAKQLRRGALSRLTSDDPNVPVKEFHKAERTAMEEVRRRLVHYDIPEPPKTRQPEAE
ncbi:MAG: DNA-directed RNA polymerase subunit omega [Vicinamibacterales bacterium]